MLTTYLPYNSTQMKRQDQLRPTILLCPGGGYGMVSHREAEFIAVHFLPEGYNVFVLTYSVAPHGFSVQLRKVAANYLWITKNLRLIRAGGFVYKETGSNPFPLNIWISFTPFCFSSCTASSNQNVIFST